MKGIMGKRKFLIVFSAQLFLFVSLSHAFQYSYPIRAHTDLKRSLNPRVIIEECTPDQQEMIDDTLGRVRTLAQAGNWASDPSRAPTPALLGLHPRLDVLQVNFRRFFYTNDTNEVRYRQHVARGFQALQRGINGRRTRQRVVVRCDDPYVLCDSRRITSYVYVRHDGKRDIVIVLSRSTQPPFRYFQSHHVNAPPVADTICP